MTSLETISLWEECKQICNELELKIDYHKNDYEWYIASRKPNYNEMTLCDICVVSANTLWHFHTALCLYYFKNKPDGKYISKFIKETQK